MTVIDEIEAERLPVAEGGRIHAICDACAAFMPPEQIEFDREYRGDTCCYSFLQAECESDSRGKFVDAPHEKVHDVWIH